MTETNLSVILVLPPKISDFIQKVKTNITGIDYPPHITIYESKFSPENFDKFSDQLTARIVSEKIRPFEAKITTVKNTRRIIYLGISKYQIIKKIHYLTVETANKFRDGIRQKDLDKINSFNIHEQKMLHKNGYPYSEECFVPHITLQRTKHTNNIQESIQLFEDKLSHKVLLTLVHFDRLVITLYQYDPTLKTYTEEKSKDILY